MVSTISYLYFYMTEKGNFTNNILFSHKNITKKGNILLFYFEKGDYFLGLGKLLLVAVIGAAMALIIHPVRAEIDLAFFRKSQPMTRLYFILISFLFNNLSFLYFFYAFF